MMIEFDETPQSIVNFWFGDNADDAAVAAEKSAMWWSKSEEIDVTIRLRFAGTVDLAGKGGLDHWAGAAGGSLALILLTDQFTRNIFRDTPEAFAFDARARQWCRMGLAAGFDRALRPIERVFFYLPMEHSEDIEDQDRSVGLFRRLVQEVDSEHRDLFDGYLDYAIRHRDIVDRFGRFPHRNAILGRSSTAEELEFLEQPGSSF